MAQAIRSNRLNLECDDKEDSFIVEYTNQGEPFREGISIGIENKEWDKSVTVMLCDNEAKQLRDFLLKQYPVE